TDVNLGLRNQGGASGWLFNLGMTGSFFRDHKRTLDYAVPFAVAPGYASVITGGTWSLEPNNDYYHVRLEATHPLKLWRARTAMRASIPACSICAWILGPPRSSAGTSTCASAAKTT